MATIKRINFTDGFSSEVTPAETVVSDAAKHLSYADDAAYVTANGAAINGAIYYNTTTDETREYISGAWRNQDAASSHTNTPAGDIVATDVQGAIDELDSEKLAKAGGTISGSLIVSGDLQVDGTTTTLNTATLDVEDANITVNNGGTEASADGADAGITIEMSDATDVSLGFDSTLTSKMKVGEVGSEAEIVTTSHAQTLSNKNYSDSISMAEIATPSTPGSGDRKIYPKSDGKFYHLNDAGLEVEMGAGGGGLDTVHTQDFETTAVASFTSGLNATYKTAGTFGGTLADETTNPISGAQSPKYTAGVTSTNDWFDIETIALDDKQRSEDIGITLYADMSNFSVDVEFVVWDNTNSAKLNSSLDILEGGAVKSRYSFSVYIPSNTASISYGFHMVNAPVSTESFIIDDFEFTLNPFVHKNLVDISNYKAVEPSNTMSNLSGQMQFSGAVTETSEGNFYNYLTVDHSTDPSTYTAKKDVSLNVSAKGISILQNHHILILVDGGVYHPSTQAYAASVTNVVSSPVFLKAGEVMTISAGTIPAPTSASFASSTADFRLVISVVAETEHIITPQNNDDIIVLGESNAGTSLTANVTDIDFIEVTDTGLGGGHWSGTVFTAPTEGIYTIAGSISYTATNTSSLYLFKNGSVHRQLQRFTSEIRGGFSTTISLNKDDTISLRSNTSLTLQVGAPEHYISITKLGFKSLSGTPVQQVAYMKDVKTSGTEGGTSTSNTVHIRDLNTLSGDTDFVSLTSNQFTLGPGKYVVEASAPAKQCNEQQLFLHDGSSYVIDGTSETAGSADSTSTRSFMDGVITIAAATTYELRHWISNGASTDGLGTAADIHVSNPQSNEIYSIVKITKLR